MGEAAIDINSQQHQSDDGIESIWDQGTLAKVKEFADLVGEVKTEREELNARLSAGKTALISMGFNKDALEAAIKYARTEEDKRQNFDLSYLYCRRALGHPVTDDLFVSAMREQVEISMSKE